MAEVSDEIAPQDEDTAVAPASPQPIRITRRVERIIFGPRPMNVVNLPRSASKALISSDGRSAYAADMRHGCLRRVAQMEDGTVVKLKRMTKAEKKAARRLRTKAMENTR